jgi:hypothetical protein
MSGNNKENTSKRINWCRLGWMIGLFVALNVAEFIILIIAVFQFLACVFAGGPNTQLVRFGRNLGRYIQQIAAYVTYASDEKPFPFAPWPDEPHTEIVVEVDIESSPPE